MQGARHLQASEACSISRELADQATYVHQIEAMASRLRSMARSELATSRTSGLCRLLTHAISNVPIYRTLFAGYGQVTIQSQVDADPFEFLRHFPVTDKRSMRELFSDYCDDDLNPAECRRLRTSGTTGEPFSFIVTIDHLVNMHALSMNRMRAQGFDNGTKVLARPCAPWIQGWSEHIHPAFGDWVIAEFGSDAAAPENEVGMLQRVISYNPDIIWTSPPFLDRFIDMLQRYDVRLPSVRLAISDGQQLPDDLRNKAVEFFQAPLHNNYGLREVGTVASECEYGARHIEWDRLVVETLDADGSAARPGEVGEIIVTNTTNLAMPFIRYRTGDSGVIVEDPCRCGNESSQLLLVEGREYGVLVRSDARTVPATTLTHVLRGEPSCRRFQIVQEEPGHASVQLCLTRPASLDLSALTRNLRKALGPAESSLRISVSVVQERDLMPSADGRKFPEFVSKMGNRGVGTAARSTPGRQ